MAVLILLIRCAIISYFIMFYLRLSVFHDFFMVNEYIPLNLIYE